MVRIYITHNETITKLLTNHIFFCKKIETKTNLRQKGTQEDRKIQEIKERFLRIVSIEIKSFRYMYFRFNYHIKLFK